MPAFKKLGPGDQIDNVLVLEPQWTLASGSGGWHGSPEGSASVNLYGGAHRQPGGVVREYQYEPIIPASHTFGDLRRSNPITASVELVWMTDEDLNLTQRTRNRWGHEHWKTVGRLYDMYYPRNVDYVTSSYDHYCLFFDSGSQNIVTVFDRYGTGPEQYSGLPTASFTVESWFKPVVTSSAGELTLVSHARAYKMYVEGATGKLVFAANSGSTTIVSSATSSVGVENRRWHHAAVSFDSITRTGTLYLDLQTVGSFVLAGGIPAPGSYTGSLQIGGRWGGAVVSNAEDPRYANGAVLGSAFHGFIGETRVWSSALTHTQLSATHNVRMTGSSLFSPLMSNVRFSEGPVSFGSPSSDPSGRAVGYASGNLMGSGVLDYAAQARGASPDFGVLYKFSDRSAPVWHPSDNVRFYPIKQLVPSRLTGTNWTGSLSPSVQRLQLFHIPSAFYGRQIQPGTVRLEDWTFSAKNIVRVLVDDGRGGLYVSGSVTAESSYSGVEWNKVGNVFYSEGLVVIKDPALLDLGNLSLQQSAHASDVLRLSFRGHSRVPVKTVVARIERGELNRSLNPTYFEVEGDGFRSIRNPSGSLYVTTVGLYNSDRELVGVARFAEPIRVRSRDRYALKIRMDF